jgi:hypothetical protein
VKSIALSHLHECACATIYVGEDHPIRDVELRNHVEEEDLIGNIEEWGPEEFVHAVVDRGGDASVGVDEAGISVRCDTRARGQLSPALAGGDRLRRRRAEKSSDEMLKISPPLVRQSCCGERRVRVVDDHIPRHAAHVVLLDVILDALSEAHAHHAIKLGSRC